jgi:DNA invertase Pin-like site-specific DNA recombinase
VIYTVLARANLVRSIDDFLDLTIEQVELLLNALAEIAEMERDAMEREMR